MMVSNIFCENKKEENMKAGKNLNKVKNLGTLFKKVAKIA